MVDCKNEHTIVTGGKQCVWCGKVPTQAPTTPSTITNTDVGLILSTLMLAVMRIRNEYNNPTVYPKAMNDELDVAYKTAHQQIQSLLIEELENITKLGNIELLPVVRPMIWGKDEWNIGDKMAVIPRMYVDERIATLKAKQGEK